jgi:TonB family protein
MTWAESKNSDDRIYVSQSNQSQEEQPCKDGIKKAVILEQPRPKYTKEAKKKKIEGTVIIKAVLSSKGEVTNIKVISGLPEGLTERAIEATKRIKFQPAMKNCRLASEWVQLEYNFKL